MKRFLSLLLCVLMVLSLVACGGTKEEAKTDAPAAEAPKADAPAAEAPAAAPAEERTVVVRCNNVFTTMNPFDTVAYADTYVFTHVYETLYVGANDGSLVPCLAKSYEVSEDGLTYTFQLEEGVKYHNGNDFTADDVVFTYTFAKDFKARATYYNNVESVTALDDYTVEFKLAKIDPMFVLYTGGMPILDEDWVKENDGQINNKCNGTGPYKFVSIDPAVHAFVTADENYRKGAADIKNVEFRFSGDNSSSVIAFEAGELDFMEIPAEMIDSIESSGLYNSAFVTPLHTVIIALNNEVKPLDDQRVRQALNYAIDREAVIEIAYEGRGIPARIHARENVFGVDFSDAIEYDYNPEKAKELLAEAGYPDGINFTEMGIHMDIIAGGYHEKVAQVFQQNLMDIGCSIELVATETPDEKAVAGDYVILNEGTGNKLDFAYNRRHYTTDGSNNWHNMSVPEIDELFDRGDVETDPEVRKEIYREAIARIIEYCPNIPVFHRQSLYAWSKDINATVYDDAGRPFFVYEWTWAD